VSLTFMLMLRRFSRAIFTVILTLAVVFDTIFVLQLLGHLFAGGLHGVNGWIMHIGAGGRIRIIDTGPGTATVKFPSRKIAYWNFALVCSFLLVLTSGSWWARRVLSQGTQAHVKV
jgi:hypothetical protein